jgi:hypothetical protein
LNQGSGGEKLSHAEPSFCVAGTIADVICTSHSESGFNTQLPLEQVWPL